MSDFTPAWYAELADMTAPRKITNPDELDLIPEGTIVRNKYGSEFVWGGYHSSPVGLAFWKQRLPLYVILIPFETFWSVLEETGKKVERLNRKAVLMRRVREN